MRISGKCSTFGGPSDETMKFDDGLALYEPKEADLRPDIFLPAAAGNPNQQTWQRLRSTFPYIALRYNEYFVGMERRQFQSMPFKVINPRTNQWVVAFLVDKGPGVKDRVVDLSPSIASALRLETDDEVCVTNEL